MKASTLPIRRRGLTVGVLAALFGIASVIVWPPAVLAYHLTGSTKVCDGGQTTGQIECTLTIMVNGPVDEDEVFQVDLTGATFVRADVTGGTCPSVPGATNENLANPTRLIIDPTHPGRIGNPPCTIIVEETLQPTGGQICQTIRLPARSPATACAETCVSSAGVISRPNQFGGQDIYGTSGNDLICGTSGNDRIYGGGGNDTIYGFGGDDQIDAGPGTDTVHAGTGNDACVNAEHTTGCERSV